MFKNIKKLFGKKDEQSNPITETDAKEQRVIKPSEIQIVFKGEDDKELIKKMKARGKINKRSKDERLANPLGTIFVGWEQKEAWITKRKSFMGWNVVCGNINTTMIRSR